MDCREFRVYQRQNPSSVLQDIAFLAENYNNSAVPRKELKGRLFGAANQILEEGIKKGFSGNLWHAFLTDLLVNDENAHSLACEIGGDAGVSLQTAALYDCMIMKEFFDYDFHDMETALGTDCMKLLIEYEEIEIVDGEFPLKGRNFKRFYPTEILRRILALAKDLKDTITAFGFLGKIEGFYKEYGVGYFGLFKAFRIGDDNGKTTLVPIPTTSEVRFPDLIGYDNAKNKLIENTVAYISGRKANNCLLFGDAGTGKSSAVKALLNHYYGQGLRMIEIYKHEFRKLNEVVSLINSRNYFFVLFLDDLSFEEFEVDYKYLKAVIEGGLEKKPGNVLIYATSNRRHLVKETFKDKRDPGDELHSSDTVQEKLSLSDRFGVTVYFGRPEPLEFQEIVRQLAIRNEIALPEKELLAEANKWELSHGGLSGRTAQQFIDYLLGVGIPTYKKTHINQYAPIGTATSITDSQDLTLLN
ncbi:MAG: ATP-binding protein [Lachnospiraceae bacterium]|jgi:predicted AAA+ superfamily ATPase|nr:ATP-binding protein [Lachnospiraceae bacterium]